MKRITLDNGRITLINDDCRNAMQQIKPGVIALVCADPPYYGVVSDKWDNQWSTADQYVAWSKEWIEQAIRIMNNTASLYVWSSIGRKSYLVMPHLILLCDQLHLVFQDMITWRKDRGMGNRKGWVYTREEILWYTKTKDYIWNELYQYGTERRKRDAGLPEGQIRVSQNGYYAKSEFKRLANVWTDISEQSLGVLQSKKHSTPKPLKAIERIVRAHTNNTEQVVLDPFLGSGTTGEVCAKLGLRFIGIEKDQTNFEEAVHFTTKALAERNTHVNT
jgi:site-specific DNA-methyltransferase (adenine-specific)